MIIQFKKRKKGFGILEVLISGVIIIIILGALVVLARNAINNSQYVQERAQAVNLAQEGMEVVRQIRDTNYIDQTPTTDWRSVVCGAGNSFSFFQYDNLISTYYITYRSDSRFCLVGGAPPAITIGGKSFYRKISFSSISGSPVLTIPTPDVSNAGANGVVVKVTVYWPNPSGDHKVEIEELLTNSRFQF